MNNKKINFKRDFNYKVYFMNVKDKAIKTEYPIKVVQFG